MMLVLFDVDKTLFMNSDPLMGQATTDAIETVWGRRLADDAIKYVDHPGQTATRITRLLLRKDGLPDEEIDAGLGRWCKEASTRYLELLSKADTTRLACLGGSSGGDRARSSIAPCSPETPSPWRERAWRSSTSTTCSRPGRALSAATPRTAPS